MGAYVRRDLSCPTPSGDAHLISQGPSDGHVVEPPQGGGARMCVLVEDILSCIKVGRVLPCYSFLGARINREAYALLRTYQLRALWYDPDAAGEKARGQYKKAFGSLLPSVDVRTPRDPKEYSTKKIKEILNDVTFRV